MLCISMAFMITVPILLVTPLFAYLGAAILTTISYASLTTPQTVSAVVVLGGGLRKHKGQIMLNHYSQSRADALIDANLPLPIITSGAESPWLHTHIKSILPNAVIMSDNASMNTCENAIFSAKLIAHHHLSPSVYLVTDRYHMARARRQFAKAGIQTIPYPAPLAYPLAWSKPQNNWMHSRRVIYEMAALTRDIIRPQNNCRQADQISITLIETPRSEPIILANIDQDYG